MRASHCRRVLRLQPSVCSRSVIARSSCPWMFDMTSWTSPSFMTTRTRRSAWMSASGSPSTAIRSARWPGVTVPTCPSTRQASAPQRVPESSASRGETPKRTRHSSSKGMQPWTPSVPEAKRTPEARWRGKRSVITRRAARSLSMIATWRAVAPLDAVLVHEDRERADQPGAMLLHQGDVVVGGEPGVLDRGDPLLHAEAQARPPVGVGRRVLAGALRLLDRGPDLLAGVDARVERGAGRADPAGGEDLHVVRPALEVLAHPAADRVDPVEGGVGAAVSVARGDAARAAEQPRPRDHPRLDRLPHLDVEEALLGHHPQRGGAGGQVAAQVRGRPQGLGDNVLPELGDLVSVTRHDRDVAVGVHQARHHEAIAPVEHLRPRGHGRGRGRAGGGDLAAVHHDHRLAHGVRAGGVEERTAADRPERHRVGS